MITRGSLLPIPNVYMETSAVSPVVIVCQSGLVTRSNTSLCLQHRAAATHAISPGLLHMPCARSLRRPMNVLTLLVDCLHIPPGRLS